MGFVHNMRVSSAAEMLEFVKNKNKQAKSLGRELGGWVNSGLTIVNQNQLNFRLQICKSCEFWNLNGFHGTGSCKKCGCSTQAKLRMATAKCPVNKWLAVK